MNTRSAKNKGARLQNFVRDLLRHLHPTLEHGDIESRTMGNSGTDIILSPSAKKLIPFDVECKNVEKFNVYKAIEQSEKNTDANRTPLLVHTKNDTDIYVTIKLSTFLQLLYGFVPKNKNKWFL